MLIFSTEVGFHYISTWRKRRGFHIFIEVLSPLKLGFVSAFRMENLVSQVCIDVCDI